MGQPNLSYAYVDTRIKAMKSRLISPSDYSRLLGMELPEITLFIEDRGYRKEIDELAPYHTGADLIEYALAQNLASTFHRIVGFVSGEGRALVEAYLGRFDALNIKEVMRGIYAGANKDKILSDIIPVGKYGKAFFSGMLSKAGSVEEAADMLRGTEYYDAAMGAMQEYKETHSLSPIEDALDRAYFSTALASANGDLAGILKMEADICNIMVLLRLKRAGMPVDKRVFIGGAANFTPDRLESISNRGKGEIIGLSARALHVPALSPEEPLHEVHAKLNRVLMASTKKMLFEYKPTIRPVLGYIAAKKIEVDNLRILARGKSAHMPSEKIAEQMII